MPEFILDHGSPEASATFAKLDSFTQGYIEAAFWLIDEDDKDATFADLAPEALADMVQVCRYFQDGNTADLAEIDGHQAGVDFWLTRNHHGAGFWDRGHGPKGDRLTTAAHVYGSTDLYRGDDGRVYVMEG